MIYKENKYSIEKQSNTYLGSRKLSYMTPTILQIDHETIQFKIAPRPDTFKVPGNILLATVLRRHMPESIQDIISEKRFAVKYEVNLSAQQVLNREIVLLEISVRSTFVFSKTEGEPDDDFWCGLIHKAIEGLKYSYSLKIKDTYMKNSKLAITRTMRDDCLKQRSIQQISVKN